MDHPSSITEHAESSSQWDARLYDQTQSFVWKNGAGLVELLSPMKGERILDLGCGTGHLTAEIAALGANVVGIDSSPAMIEQARRNYPHLRFQVADGAQFSFPEPFDAVFSNAALHWMKEPRAVVACIWPALIPGGRMVVEFGGKGNVQSIVRAAHAALEAVGAPPGPEFNLWYFPSIGEYASLLESQGFSVTFAQWYDRPTPLEGGEEGMRNWLEVFSGSFFSVLSPEKRDAALDATIKYLRPRIFRDGEWVVDYKRLRVVAIKDTRK
jgi:trans-aconitate methyltransferase